jgi:hypothetical protein
MLRFASRRPSVILTALVLALAVVAGNHETEAHKAVTSPYTYNLDIYPILREHCGRCHVEGGPAPMALLTWNEGPNSATPWAESIRQALVGEQMPPWYVDPQGPAVKGGFSLSPAQSDKLLTWATGGTPQGDPEKKLSRVTYQSRWSGGPPDLQLGMEPGYTMGARETDVTKEFVIPTGLNEQRWLKAVDVLPGAPEIVRNAAVSLENGVVLSVWAPGDNLISAPAGTAFRLPAGAKLRLQIHYKKQWQNEGKAIQDRSIVGLYFTTPPAPAGEIQSLDIDRPKGNEGAAAFGGSLAVKARVVAVRPSLDRVYGAFAVQAITPSGARKTLLKLRMPRPEWRRRYWLAEPIELPAGTRIEVTTTPPSAYIDLTGAQFMKTYPLQAALDFVRLP